MIKLVTGRVVPVSGSTIDVRPGALLFQRIDDVDPVIELAGQFVQHLDHLHPALAVADQQRRDAVVLVHPGQFACDVPAVFVRAVGEIAAGRIANPVLGVAHAGEEARKRFHHQMHGVDAPVDVDDVRRRALGESVAYIAVGDVQGIERQDARRDAGLDVRSAQDNARCRRGLRKEDPLSDKALHKPPEAS